MKKKCKVCNIEKDISQYTKYLTRKKKNGEYQLFTKCKECCNKLSKDYNKLKRIYKNPIHKHCYCCNKYSSNLILDHDHITNEFRGWLCKSCNVGIGHLQDNLEGVKRALQYLKQSKIKQLIV